MRRHSAFWIVLAALSLACTTASAWTTVGDGIEYAEYTVTGQNKVFVSRMDRANPNVFIESSIGQGRISGGTERTSSQASRYDDAINYWGSTWGQRNDVIVAINGSYYNTSTGVPTSGMIHSGWYAKRYDNLSWESGFVWQLDRDAFIGACVTHVAAKQVITYTASGNTQTFHGINIPRGSDNLIIYTPQYDSNTLTDGSGTEVLVELSRPMLLLGSPAMVTGHVREIRQNQGSTPIPFDHVVLSATGSNATTLRNRVSLGAEIGISQEIRSFEGNCSTPGSLDWSKSYAAVSGNWVFLRNNVIQYGIDSSGLRHPRTAIALNNSYVFFIVVDGRSTSSIGMTIDELAGFCKTTLGATWGVNQDGGGSSTMLINGTIKNVPSDGSERAVSNGLMMVNIAPRIQSTALAADDVVRTNAAGTAVRLGPGTNYASIATLGGNVQGTVLDHELKGVMAKGTHWWKCSFASAVGWVSQSQLDPVSAQTPPTITQHPTSATILGGGGTSFTVQAEGTAPLTYRWQRNSVDLEEEGHYSNVMSNQLTISSASKADAGDYRCKVTNSLDTAFSNAAELRVLAPDFDGDLDVDQADFGYLQSCLGITDLTASAPACADADLTLDDRVNEADFAVFQTCISGEGIPATPPCAG